MGNYKSFVFGHTNSKDAPVTPSQGRYHVYVNDSGQLQVINHLGEVVPQNLSVSSMSSTEFASITMVPQTVAPPPAFGTIFFSAGTGLMICNGTGDTNWTWFYTQHAPTPF